VLALRDPAVLIQAATVPEGERPSAMQGAVVALAEQDRLPQAGGAVPGPGVDVVRDQSMPRSAAAAGAFAVAAGLDMLDPPLMGLEGAGAVTGLQDPVSEPEDEAGDVRVAPPLPNQAERQ
jgi:hypothetical protein